MKSVLLYANEDDGLEARLQAALDAVRLFNGHLTCLQVTPFEAFVTADPFGGVYALPSILEAVRRTEEQHRAEIEKRLANDGVSWDWLRVDGGAAQLILDRSRLADLIVLTLPADDDEGPTGLVPDVAVHARSPLLAVPKASKGCDLAGTALVAWNGSPEAAHAIRLALPILTAAAAVHIVTVVEDRSGFPSTEACEYLARHGVDAQLHEWPRGRGAVGEAIAEAATVLGAAFILMGAYGHSRMREAVLGGVTRELLHGSAFPLLLAH